MPTNDASTSELSAPTKSEFRHILKISLPLALGYLGELMINVTDNIMLGHLGPEALGAAGLALSVYFIIEMIGLGMLFPVMVLASQARGSGRSRLIPKLVRQGLWISGFLSVPGMVVLWNLKNILLMAGQDPILAELAGQYMDYYLWAVFPAFTTFAFVLAFSAMERGVTIAVVVWCQVALNIVLNYILIFGHFGFPAMGMAGAGLASLIVHGAAHMVFFGLFAFYGFWRSMALFRRAWRPEWDTLEQLTRLGWPKTFEAVMRSCLLSVVALLAGWLGIQEIAAHTIAYQVFFVISFSLPLAVAGAVAVRIGIASGRGDNTALWGILNSGIVISLLFMLPPILGLKLFSPWIVVLFTGTGPKAQALVPLAAPVIPIVSLFLIVDGLRMVTVHSLNGLADIKAPAFIAAFAYWGIAFPACLVFGFMMDFGVIGLWLGLTVGVAVLVAGYLIRFREMVAKRTG
uniref:Multidrug-efflux transporter n=1 Tax=Candidatus Kentrum sp. LFY TaxID=2126342 RepID=A0A450WT57_9GAMM|nr:MAG: multidrug resistance protein, MATE family [Candidatus Kentron sp. LFY]